MNADLWPTDAELDELATISATSRRSSLCVPQGAAYSPDGAGGRTIAPPESWREVTGAGIRPQRVANDRRPAGDAQRDRRQWIAVTAPDVDLLDGNPARLVVFATLATFTSATTNGTAGELNYAVVLGDPTIAETATVRVWYLEQTEPPA